MLAPASVDVAIQVYGKPYQTAVALLSLLRHSERWIDRIYFIEERRQPPGADFRFLLERLGPRVIHYRPWFWVGVRPMNLRRLWFPPYRRSVIYQYAWEHTPKQWLFTTHNDMLYRADLIGEYAQRIGDAVAIGRVGQCWNCPAHHANLCDGSRYRQYKPTTAELRVLMANHPAPRGAQYPLHRRPWPLPECRLNEFAALINLEKARPLTMPHGPALPFGGIGHIDIGVDWFWEIHQRGHHVAHCDYSPWAEHGWVQPGTGGNEAMTNRAFYDHGEAQARELLRAEFDLAV